MSKFLVYNVITPLGYPAQVWTDSGKKDPTYGDLVIDEEMRIMEMEKAGFQVLKTDGKSDKPKEKINGKTCPKCSGEVWDNRGKIADGTFKKTSPDFSCKNKETCKWAIWVGKYEIVSEEPSQVTQP